MSNLPDRVPRSVSLTPVQRSRAGRATRRAEAEVYEHHLRAVVRAQQEQAEARALAEVITYATEEELRLLDYGLARANGSEAHLAIVAEKVALLSHLNTTRIRRQFG